MFDPAAPSSRRALDELARPGVRDRLLWIARRRSPSKADAEDLVAGALMLVFDPDRRPWDPAAAPFVGHMAYVMRDLAAEQARSWSARRVVVDTVFVVQHDAADGAPLADEALAEHEGAAHLRRLGVALRARVEGDARALQVLDCAAEGLALPAEQAARIGCPVDEVREALRRLKYHGKKILEEEAEKGAGRRILGLVAGRSARTEVAR